MRLSLPLAVALAAGISTAAYADGYGPGPSYAPRYNPTWTGFYVGVNGGYAWSDYSDQFSVPAVSFGGLAPKGGFGGGQIGYNWQAGHILLGVEADIQGAGIDDNKTVLGVDFKSGLDYFGTVRGRLGYAFGPSLLYATSGFAYGGVKNEIAVPGVIEFKNAGTATGYTIGGGYEYKFNPGWSLKTEYQYIDLSKNDPTLTGVGDICALAAGVLKCRDDAFHTLRIGLNYQFGSDRYLALK
jgi:outer membrane immunogenic protein